ncbi:MAG: nucleotidyltransferase [Deltaproteobacteria bacterium RBG_13_43_22]|jgi:predicted nucleotidyltransferase|nr:MAG: nucleotidyltransferase [Deltaproteobacteria bacterium RBG_13_43_22]
MKKNNRETILQELRRIKPDFEQRYGVTKIGIFGSLARNEIREDSDVDVVLEMREPDLFYMVHIKETLEERLKMPVDVIRYRTMMNSRLKARIDREAVYV